MATKARGNGRSISVRLPSADLALIDQAARSIGRSRAEFIREAALRVAEDPLIENRPIRMSPEGFAEFLTTLAQPATPVPEMVELFRRPPPWPSNHR